MAQHVPRDRNISYFNRFFSLAVIWCSLNGSFIYASESPYIKEARAEHDLLDHEQILSLFGHLEENISCSNNKDRECLHVISSFIEEVNTQYNLAISFIDVCNYLECKLLHLKLNSRLKESVAAVISRIQTVDSTDGLNFLENSKVDAREVLSAMNQGIVQLPFFWEWRLFNSPQKGKKDLMGPFSSIASVANTPYTPVLDENIPDNLVIAGVEMMVASLLALIPSGYAKAAAGVIFTDALNRGANGLAELSAINKEAEQMIQRDQENWRLAP